MNRVLKIGIAATFALVAALAIAEQTSAHTLITDQTGQKGAILHIMPDDDPIAGQEATLFFDTQGGLLTENSKISLVIHSVASGTTTIDVKIDGSLATSKYTFPVQGVYSIVYTVANTDSEYVFEQSTRISRGTASQAGVETNTTWAEGLLVLTGALGLILAIIAFNHRHKIASQSKL